MPYPSPITYPSPSLYPGFAAITKPAGRIASLGGLVLGERDTTGVKFSLNKLDGWDGSPASTLNLTQRARGHGSTGSEPFLASRFMTAEGKITAPSLALLEEAFRRLNAAVSLEGFELLVVEAAGMKNCRAQRQGAVITDPITDTVAAYSVLIVAEDPLKYGDLVTATTLLPSSTGGLVYPVTYPVTFTGVSNSGVIRVINGGNAQAPVWLRIDGPVPSGGWTVTHVGKKQSLTFASSLALGTGEFVTVDMERREILAQGQSARAGYVTSRGWFSLDPGVNDIAFSAQNYSATAQLTVTTKPAWS